MTKSILISQTAKVALAVGRLNVALTGVMRRLLPPHRLDPKAYITVVFQCYFTFKFLYVPEEITHKYKFCFHLPKLVAKLYDFFFC